MRVPLLVALSIVCMTGCSYVSSFYVYNLSEAAVVVQYRLNVPISYGVFTTDPQVYAIEKNNNEETLMKILPGQVDYTTSTKVVRALLQPQQALCVGEEVNTHLGSAQSRKRLGTNLTELLIINTESADTLRCAGTFVGQLFQELGEQRYAIRVE